MTTVEHDDGIVRQLRIYLNDHRAGSVSGRALAERCGRSNVGTPLGDYLMEEFLPELEDERTLLGRVRRRFETPDNPFKQVAARAGVVVGRAKLNGSLTEYTPLSRVVELEALIAAVSSKRQLWQTLSTLTTSTQNPFAARIDDADEQRRRLEQFHREAVIDAFGYLDPDLDR